MFCFFIGLFQYYSFVAVLFVVLFRNLVFFLVFFAEKLQSPYSKKSRLKIKKICQETLAEEIKAAPIKFKKKDVA